MTIPRKDGPTLFERLDSAGKMPTPPAVVLRLLELVRRPDVSVQEIATTIGMDPALTAKILRFVNSPMTGVAREVASLPQAVALIGVRAVKMMALSFAVVSNRVSGCAEFSYDQFVLQSLACGAAAKNIAYTTRWAPAQEAFVAGLLSQIGWSALARALPREYAEILQRAKRVPRDLPSLELTAFGETYATVGGQLLRSWGLPETLCSAICDFRNEGAPMTPSLALLLNIAEAAADCLTPYRPLKDTAPEEFLELAKKHLQYDEQECLSMLARVRAEVEEARAAFDLPPGRIRTTEEIQEQIRDGITELSLAMHLENKTLVQQQEELLRRATTDPLTGVGNRAAFDARLLLELERTARTHEPLGLLMIDVDHFKNFNDNYGHQAGDRVLQTVARLLDEHVRKVDYVARYGGEEFTVVMPATDRDGVLHVAERLRSGIEAMHVRWEGKDLRITISIGVGLVSEVSDARDAAVALIRSADDQLYAAKCSGRNQVAYQKVRPVRPEPALTKAKNAGRSTAAPGAGRLR